MPSPSVMHLGIVSVIILFVALYNMIDRNVFLSFAYVCFHGNHIVLGWCTWRGWRADTSWASFGKTTCGCINWEGVKQISPFSLLQMLNSKFVIQCCYILRIFQFLYCAFRCFRQFKMIKIPRKWEKGMCKKQEKNFCKCAWDYFFLC